MTNNESPAKGYYSILQFVPDLERSEGANIGVVLFCPEKHFLKVQTATGNDRVRRFFGPEDNIDLDLDRFDKEFTEHVHADRVNEDFMSGVRSGVNGTPTFFINGVRHDDSYDFEILLGALQRAAEIGEEG